MSQFTINFVYSSKTLQDLQGLHFTQQFITVHWTIQKNEEIMVIGIWGYVELVLPFNVINS